MSRPIAVVSSDNHLEPYAWAARPGLCGDSHNAFQQTTDYCLSHRLPLILAGDVFNRAYPDPFTVWWTVYTLNSLSERGLGVYYVQGQHELNRETPWLQLVPGAVHLHRNWCRLPAIGVPNFKFYGLDYLPVRELSQALTEIPKDTDVLVAHQVWGERMGQKSCPEAYFKDVPKVRCIITGDFHGHTQDHFRGADGQDILVVSPGSQCMQEVSEDPDKFFFVMHDDLTFESVPLRSRQWRRFTLRNLATFDTELAGLVVDAEPQKGVWERLAKPAFVVRYHPEIPEARSRLREALADKVHLFDSPLEVVTEGTDDKVRLDALRRGLFGCLEEVCRDAPGLYATAKRLLDAGDPKAEIVRVIEELKEEFEGSPFVGLSEQPEGRLGVD